jgi:hypothetical protein
MKIDINKDFETAYQQSIWKGLDLKQLITVGCFLPTVIGIMVVLWYFLNVPPQGGVYIGILAAPADPVFGTVQIPGNVYPYVMQRMEVSAENKETLWGNRNCSRSETPSIYHASIEKGAIKRNGNF